MTRETTDESLIINHHDDHDVSFPAMSSSTPTTSSNLLNRRGSASPRESKDWNRGNNSISSSTMMTALDPERRGSAGAIPNHLTNHRVGGTTMSTSTSTSASASLGPGGERLLRGQQGGEVDLDPGTPSHDHGQGSSGSLASSFWGKTGDVPHHHHNPSPPPLASDRFSFPPSTHPSRPPSTLTQLIHSKLFRNLLILLLSLFLLISALHTTQPEALGSGMKYLSGKLPAGLSRLGREEMKSLDQRLRDLMARPVLEQWEMELTNRYQCPMYTFSRMTYFFNEGKEEEWKSINHADIRKYRNKMIAYLKEVEEAASAGVEGSVGLVWTQKDVGGSGRGIVLTGGEGSTIPRLHLLLKQLRETLNCKLPIEIYHFPDEMQDPQVRADLVAWGGVKVVQLGAKQNYGEKQWHIKTAAFIQTEFYEFVYMDSDNIPLIDPAELFDSVEYQDNRSVFWPDLSKDHPDNAIWRILGRPCSDEHWPAETGQVVFDKRGNNGLNLAVLHLANHMMTSPDLYGFLGYGDKDTFRWSFYALGLPYQQAPRQFASTGGFQRQGGEPDPDYFCGHSMLHWGLTPLNKRNDPSYHPPPAFLHTILSKHRKNLDPSKLWSHVRKPRLDGISEPSLTRTLYEFTGDCFAITLKGPDGLMTSPNSFRDGQGLLTLPLADMFGEQGESHKVYQALMEIAPKFVAMA